MTTDPKVLRAREYLAQAGEAYEDLIRQNTVHPTEHQDDYAVYLTEGELHAAVRTLQHASVMPILREDLLAARHKLERTLTSIYKIDEGRDGDRS